MTLLRSHVWISASLATRAPGAAGWSRAGKVAGTDPCANPYLTADGAGRVYLSWLRYNRSGNSVVLCKCRSPEPV